MAGSRFMTVETCGLGFFWSWCYCLWFIPDVYQGIGIQLPGAQFAWLAVLGSAAVVQFCVPVLFRARPLSSFPSLNVIVPAAMLLGTVGIELTHYAIPSEALYYGSSVLAGASSAVLWHQWGERYAVTRNTDAASVALAFGVIVGISLIVSSCVPAPIADAYVAVIPLISGFLLRRSAKSDVPVRETVLLPKASRRMGQGALVKVSLMVFLVCAACTFTWVSMPVLAANAGAELLRAGIVAGAAFMIAAALPSLLFGCDFATSRLLLWAGLGAIIAVALRTAGASSLIASSFVLSVSISVVLDVLLASYFVALVVKGYAASATAFGFSEGFICAAMLVGNLVARLAFGGEGGASQLPVEIGLGLMCLLSLLLLLLGEQQDEIDVIMTAPPEITDVERNCRAIADEFGLSAREYEILVLLGQGHTTQSLARVLVLSPYTVQTHIKHIYAKIGIHRRAELMDYVNLKRTSFDEA